MQSIGTRMPFEFHTSLNERLHQAIALAWTVFSEQVGNGRLQINKEASMQLQYSYILQSLLPMVLHHPDEHASIELETGVQLNDRTREIDLLLEGRQEEHTYRCAVEMKCYRRLASSGKKRGAQDIFRKDVYEDMQLLEQYRQANHADAGIALVMTDHRALVHPVSKESKCHDYDIADQATFDGGTLTTPIGGKSIDITLHDAYRFVWKQVGEFYFLQLEPQPAKGT